MNNIASKKTLKKKKKKKKKTKKKKKKKKKSEFITFFAPIIELFFHTPCQAAGTPKYAAPA